MSTKVGPMIAALAAAKGITYAELAALIGVHRNRFSDKVKGNIPFRESEISAIAEHLGVSPGQLFDDPVALLTGSSPTSTPCFDVYAGQQPYLRAVA